MSKTLIGFIGIIIGGIIGTIGTYFCTIYTYKRQNKHLACVKLRETFTPFIIEFKKEIWISSIIMGEIPFIAAKINIDFIDAEIIKQEIALRNFSYYISGNAQTLFNRKIEEYKKKIENHKNISIKIFTEKNIKLISSDIVNTRKEIINFVHDILQFANDEESFNLKKFIKEIIN